MPCEHLRQRSTNSFPFFFILREGKSKGSSFSILLLRSLRSTRCPICPGCLAISAKIPFSQAVQGRKLKTQANPVPQADGTPCIFRFFCFVKNILDEFSECLSCFSGISAPPPPHAQLQLLHGPEVLRQFVLVINDCRRLSTKSICLYFTQ